MSGSTKRGFRAHLTLAMALIVFCTTFIFTTPAQADQNPKITTAVSSTIAKGMNAVKSNALTSDDMSGEFYFAQSGSGRCTISSIAMMVRRAAFLDNRSDWSDIDEAYVSSTGWCGAGVKNEFDTAGYSINIINIEGSNDSLKELLKAHPEGVAIYDPGVPHAVLLTDYDEKSDTFYCADPATYYSGSRIALADSWNGERHGHDQEATVTGFSSAWVIV